MIELGPRTLIWNLGTFIKSYVYDWVSNKFRVRVSKWVSHCKVTDFTQNTDPEIKDSSFYNNDSGTGKKRIKQDLDVKPITVGI